MKNAYLMDLMERVEKRNPNDKQFLITVRSVLDSIEPVVEARPELIEKGVMEMFVEPERVIKFRVAWVDDSGQFSPQRVHRLRYSGKRAGILRAASERLPAYRQVAVI